jgi:hypothetical protein
VSQGRPLPGNAAMLTVDAPVAATQPEAPIGLEAALVAAALGLALAATAGACLSIRGQPFAPLDLAMARGG